MVDAHCVRDEGGFTVQWLIVAFHWDRVRVVNPFTTGTPFLGIILLEFSIGRDLGALKGLRVYVRIIPFEEHVNHVVEKAVRYPLISVNSSHLTALRCTLSHWPRIFRRTFLPGLG